MGIVVALKVVASVGEALPERTVRISQELVMGPVLLGSPEYVAFQPYVPGFQKLAVPPTDKESGTAALLTKTNPAC